MATKKANVKVGQKVKVTSVDVYKALSSKGFVFHDDVVNTLFMSHEAGLNCILYGEGGYGKSEMALAFAEAMGYKEDNIGVFSVSNETSPDELFGNVDLEKLTKDQKYHINIEKSAWSKELVILEEAFDGNPSTMAALKQMLTSGYFEYNDQKYKIKTKMVIICTNKSPNEFNVHGTDSINALIQRFPIQLKVKWDDMSANAYFQLLSAKFGKLNKSQKEALSEVYTNTRHENKRISPRIAIQSTKLFMVNRDLRDLKMVLPDIDDAFFSRYSNITGSEESKKANLNYSLELDQLNTYVAIFDPFLKEMETRMINIKQIPDPNQQLASAEASQRLISSIKNDIDDAVKFVDELVQEQYQQLFLDPVGAMINELDAIMNSAKTKVAQRKSNMMLDMLADGAAVKTKIQEEISKL